MTPIKSIKSLACYIAGLLIVAIACAAQADDLYLKKNLQIQPLPLNSAASPVSPADTHSLNPQPFPPVESTRKPAVNSQIIVPETNLPALVSNMSAPLNNGSTVKPLNQDVQLKAMQPVSFEEATNKQKCADKRCILDINGLPLSQVVMTAAKTPNRYTVNGWGFAGKVLFATLNVNNSNKINLKVISNSSTQVQIELPNDIGRTQNGMAQLLIAMSGDGYAVYAKELIKFEVVATDDARINTAEIGSTHVKTNPKIEPKSLSACKNCIESVNNKLNNILYEVGGGNLMIKGDGFGEKSGRLLLHLNGQPGNKVVPLEIVGGGWSSTLIVAKVPEATSGVLDDNNTVLELIKSDGQPLSGVNTSKVRPGQFKAAREITTLSTVDIPRKIQQEAVAPTNMLGDFYHQELYCEYQDTNCEALKHGFTDVFTVDTKEGFEILKDQTMVQFDYKKALDDTYLFNKIVAGNGGLSEYWYPQNKPYGDMGSYEWQGDRLIVKRYMYQQRHDRFLGKYGNSAFLSSVKVLVKVRGPRGISPLHVSNPVSKKD